MNFRTFHDALSKIGPSPLLDDWIFDPQPNYFTLLKPTPIRYPMFTESRRLKEHFESLGFKFDCKAQALDEKTETYVKGNLKIRIHENSELDIGIKGVKNESFSMFTTISQFLPTDKYLDEAFFRFWETYKTFHGSYFNLIKDKFPHGNFIYYVFDYMNPRNPQFRFEDESEKMKCVIPLDDHEALKGELEILFKEFTVEKIDATIEVRLASLDKITLSIKHVPMKDDPKEELLQMLRNICNEMKTSLTKADFDHGKE